MIFPRPDRLALLLAALLALGGETTAETLPAVSQRYEPERIEETPDFQKHVVPLLGRLGCNGRNCHGSFQGRGGFRLSLFGYDFQMDHTALTAAATSAKGRRIDRTAADDSLLLLKPTLRVDHEGGDRFPVGSWEHHLLRRWIETGAAGVTKEQELQRLEIEPAEVVFAADSPPVQLRVVAVWGDGSREDVTPLCRFRTNDDAIVTVSENGQMTSAGPGDTHVIAFYDNGVAAVPVLRAIPGSDPSNYPEVPARTKIDEFVQDKLQKLGIVPAALCTDAEFLRRVSIDLTGTLPTPEEIESFLADSSPEKRQRKIEELLQRPTYAAWWTNKLCDFTGCNPQQQAELGQEVSVQWYMWIYQRVVENTPYDQLVERIVLATSREPGQAFDEYCRELTDCFRDESAAEFASRETMPHYWTRRTLEPADEKALAFAHSFLGIRLQCAQCHKHPFAPWTQQDFQQFSAFFNNLKFGVAPDARTRYRELAQQVGLPVPNDNGSAVRPEMLRQAQEGKTLPWRELYIAPRNGPAKLNLLRSGAVELRAEEDPRTAIMQWMKQPDNPWFATAFVNRVWAGYFDTGIVEPPDDLNPANPPSHPALLAWLTRGFIDSGYDMQWLHRQILSSDAYQRSWQPNETNRGDRRNYSRAIPRRIPAEVVYDGLKQAVAADAKLQEVRTDLTRRATGHLSMRLAGTYAMQVFGKPARSVNCDCERVNAPTLLQSIFVQNDPLVDQWLSGSGWVEEIARREQAGNVPPHDELIRAAWLRTVGHPPTAEEVDRAARHLAQAGSLPEGVRDLLWALVNTKEFLLNH